MNLSTSEEGMGLDIEVEQARNTSRLPEYITIPSETTQTHTVVFLHGRGDTAGHFLKSLPFSPTSEGKTLQQSFPSFKWVYPKATFKPLSSFAHRPLVSQWFDVWNTKDFQEREDLQAEGLKTSVFQIRALLAHEAGLLDGRWDHIILMGISQGAATSVHTLLNLNIDLLPGDVQVTGERRLGAFIGFSCRMPFTDRSLSDTRAILGLSDVPNGDEVLRNTPVLLEHCVNDPLVLVQYGRNLLSTLTSFGVEVTWKEYPNGGHWFNSPQGMDDAVHFVKTYVLENESFDHEEIT